MRQSLLLLVLCESMGVSCAATIVNFEDLPIANIADFCGGGGTNIGAFYAGVGVAGIGANAFGLDHSPDDCGGTVGGFPAASGSINLFSTDDLTTITFSSLVSNVSFEYVALDTITLTAYDSGNNMLGSSDGMANTDGTTGADSLISVSFPHIASVTLGNTGLADQYTFDDLSFTQEPQETAPEPASWVLVIAGAAGVAARKVTGAVWREHVSAKAAKKLEEK